MVLVNRPHKHMNFKWWFHASTTTQDGKTESGYEIFALTIVFISGYCPNLLNKLRNLRNKHHAYPTKAATCLLHVTQVKVAALNRLNTLRAANCADLARKPAETEQTGCVYKNGRDLRLGQQSPMQIWGLLLSEKRSPPEKVQAR